MLVRFGVNPRLAIGNVRQLRKRIVGGSEIAAESLIIQEQIKRVVTAKLQNDAFSRRDPRATKRGFGTDIAVIIAAITTGVKRGKFRIISGTGVASKMDAGDPLLQRVIPRILKPRSRLWRILEFGSLPHEIVARNLTTKPQKKLTERPKGVGITRTERLSALQDSKKPRGNKKQGPQLRFFWRRNLTAFKGPIVNHPGQVGRAIWTTTSRFEARKLFRAGMRRVLKKIVASHSRR